ncbi:hypothetical protein SNOG_10673 [Parastagonospora nodorum SN15]|uniref:Rhodopsin domain-containing protein n=1 Tax=Phaeosphaeria nodorum (strain SN15 / ATCC MYA-4574 / FGSC 10173) TaxID=321614 RepID=Q0UC41_PHANO|nr:hypothetical protein SNOG_10673 [Parastagonospora nodorum SN15]EAT82067.2 hypothetical protein SNOG_10673 [Parastagonospora nodorum SN15]
MAKEDRSPEFIGVLGFFITICTLLVLLRCYTKVFIVKNFAADDWFSVLTLISFLVFCTLARLGISNGTGKRRYLIPDEKLPNGMKWWWCCEPTYVITNIFLKFSIGIFLLRIAVDRSHRIILWTCLIAIQVYSVYFFFIFTFQCWPVSYFWEQFRGGKGHCIPSNVIVNSFYGYSALSCVTDWTFSIVPIFIVRKLQMNSRKKWTVGIVLACFRIPFINGLNDIPDFLYSTIDVAIWSTCETGIGLATSAAATLRPLLRQVFSEMSTHDSASRKPSRWGASTHPTRSGYLEHGSQGDHNDIQLTNHDSKNNHVHVVGGGGGSPSGSTIVLNKDWDQHKESWNTSPTGSISNNKGIMKTVKITQL